MTAAPRLRILLVEDEHIVALDLQGILEDLGYAVAGHAGSAEEAIALAASTRPDVILMDIHLGAGADGIDAARRIKGQSDVPIVFTTAYDDDRTLVRAEILEPYGYILKPYQSRELRVCLEIAAYRHTMERERVRLKQELETALAENRILQGLLTSCCQCHRIRDGKEWITLESYVQRHSGLRISHGFCPECEVRYLESFRNRPAES